MANPSSHRVPFARSAGIRQGQIPRPRLYRVVECRGYSAANGSMLAFGFSPEGGKRVATAEFCLPPSGAKSD
jgi:hypothetical protein